VLSRKKAKICKLSATDVVTDNPDCPSAVKNDKPDSNIPEEENKTDLPMSLSQSGKFIPKFMAKKKLQDCVMKIECVSKLVESDNCDVPASETEVGISSVTDEAKDACADCEAVTDTCNKLTSVECMVGKIASKPDESDCEQVTSANNDSVKGTGSNKQGLSVNTAFVEDIEVGDRLGGSTLVVVNESSSVTGVGSGNIGHHINSSHTDQQDVKDPTKLLVLPSDNISGSRATAQHTSAVETAPEADGDSTDTKALEIARHNDKCPVNTDDAVGGSRTASNDIMMAQTVDDASGDISSEAVTEVCGDVPQARDNVEAAADAVLSSAGDERKMASQSNTHNGAGDISSSSVIDAAVKELPISIVSDEIHGESKTTADHFDTTMPVNGAPARDLDTEVGGNSKVNAVSEAKEVIPGSAELPSFDDFLDLTDSQLCQLDDISR